MAWLDFIKKYTLVISKEREREREVHPCQKQMPTPANKFLLKVIIE
jgi:hypothetical protein